MNFFISSFFTFFFNYTRFYTFNRDLYKKRGFYLFQNKLPFLLNNQEINLYLIFVILLLINNKKTKRKINICFGGKVIKKMFFFPFSFLIEFFSLVEFDFIQSIEVCNENLNYNKILVGFSLLNLNLSVFYLIYLVCY